MNASHMEGEEPPLVLSSIAVGTGTVAAEEKEEIN